MKKYLQPDWPAPLNVKAYTTLRTSWGDHSQYGESDDAAKKSDYALKILLQLPTNPLWITQKHTSIAIEATPENKDQIADATFSKQPNQVCAILTADCLPVLICNKKGTHVAAIHAGWRGLAGGIIESTLQALAQPADDLLVWFGPAIGPQKFEVGKDVYAAFTQKHRESAAAFTPHTEDKWLADLYALAKIRLKIRGISQIYGGDFCTYTQDDLFFSYRRDKSKTGRMASLIWIDGN